MDKNDAIGGRLVSWQEAPCQIAQHLAQIPREFQVVAITGRVGAGKSSLARRLGGVVVSTDDYLPDYEGLDPAVRDDPRHADLALLARHIGELKQGLEAQVPIWSFKTHRREGTRPISPAPLVVVEGIHALHATVAAAVDCAVFVQASVVTRWSRWEAIELAGERGWGVTRAKEHFDNVAEPTFSRFESSYMAAAHFVVANDQGIRL